MISNRETFKGPGVRIYGASDDLVEMDGEVRGEEPSDEKGNIVVLSDGSMLNIHYDARGVWEIKVLRKGELFDRLEECDTLDGDDNHPLGYSDQAYFKPGIEWAMCGRRMQ